MGQNIATCISNRFFHIFHEEYLVKQKVVFVPPLLWLEMTRFSNKASRKIEKHS